MVVNLTWIKLPSLTWIKILWKEFPADKKGKDVRTVRASNMIWWSKENCPINTLLLKLQIWAETIVNLMKMQLIGKGRCEYNLNVVKNAEYIRSNVYHKRAVWGVWSKWNFDYIGNLNIKLFIVWFQTTCCQLSRKSSPRWKPGSRKRNALQKTGFRLSPEWRKWLPLMRLFFRS